MEQGLGKPAEARETVKQATRNLKVARAHLEGVELKDEDGTATNEAIPTEYALLPAYPNPFNPSITEYHEKGVELWSNEN